MVLGPLEGKCLLYSSLQEMISDLLGLPREGIKAGNLRYRVSRRGRLAPPPSACPRLPNYPGFRSRSELEDGRPHSRGSLLAKTSCRRRSVSDGPLTECYCSSGALAVRLGRMRALRLVKAPLFKSQLNSAESVNPPAGSVHASPDDHSLGQRSQRLCQCACSLRPLIRLGMLVGKTISSTLFRVDAKDSA